MFHTYIVSHEGKRVIDVSNGLTTMCDYDSFAEYNCIDETYNRYVDISVKDYNGFMSFINTHSGRHMKELVDLAFLEVELTGTLRKSKVGEFVKIKEGEERLNTPFDGPHKEHHIQLYTLTKAYLDLLCAEVLWKKKNISIVYYPRNDDTFDCLGKNRDITIRKYMEYVRDFDVAENELQVKPISEGRGVFKRVYHRRLDTNERGQTKEACGVGFSSKFY